jgi:hypothetical protein
VLAFGLVECYGIKPISFSPFVLMDCLFALVRSQILGPLGEVVLSPLTIDSIVLSVPSIMGATVNPAGKDF